ncbi:MAG: hypothetical protein EGQ85_03890 [Faecalibacterium prausnitzii]|nr:hypothetical protein [Faecalibacterium prausnitzii]
MKKLSKIVALLLAGAMAMVMLTACTGGGNTGSNLKEDTKTEAEVLSKYSTSTVAAKNDKALKAEAENFLNEKLNVSGSIFGYKFVLGYDVKGKTENAEFLTVLVAANVTYKDTLLGAILDEISRKINTDTNVNINQDGNWTKIGVVVKTDVNTKQSYMAIAFQIKNPNYHK